MMTQKIISDDEFNEDDFNEWAKSVTITRYEHDFEKKQRIITYQP